MNARVRRTAGRVRAVTMLAIVGTALIACRSGSSASPSSASDTVAMRLERGPCYGRCPEYLVEILENGTVRFVGRKHVNVLGAQQRTISASQVRALQNQFAETGFATMDSAYIEGAKGCGRFLSDGPRMVLGARVGTAMKSVQHDAGCTDAPRVLQTLAAQVDSVARTSAWIAGAGDTK